MTHIQVTNNNISRQMSGHHNFDVQIRVYIKSKVKLSCYMPWRCLWREEYSFYSFTTSALDGGEWSVSRPSCALPSEKDASTHRTGGWVGPRASLDTKARGRIPSPLPGMEPQSTGRPVCSQTLYWLSYLAPRCVHTCTQTYAVLSWYIYLVIMKT
jgi:hypothetical protein